MVFSTKIRGLSWLDNAIWHLGVHEQKKFRVNAGVRASNILSSVIILFAFLYAPAFIFLQLPLIWPITLVAITLFSIVLLLNFLNRTDASRIFLIVVYNTFHFLLCLQMGRNSGVEIFFVLAMIYPFLLLDFSERYKLVFALVLPIFYALLFQYLRHLPLGIPFNNMDPKTNDIIFTIFLLSTLFIVIGILNFFFRVMEKYEQAQLEEAKSELSHIKALMFTAIEQSPAGVIIADAPNASIRFVNSAAVGIRNVKIDGLKNIPWEKHPMAWKTYYPDGRLYQGQDLPLSRAILNGETIRGEKVQIEDGQGRRRWVLAHAAPVLDEAGNIVAGVVVFPDISEQIAVEKQLKELNDNLERHISDRTTELAKLNRQLQMELRWRQKAERELNIANKDLKETTSQLVQAAKLSALGELTAGVAHELNQPLNVIKIIGQSILRDIEKQRFDLQSAKEDLPEILDQVNKMAEIIDHMGIFTRRSEGEAMQPVDINSLIAGAFKFMGQQLKDHDIIINKVLADDLWIVWGNAIRLEQTILNLLNNARYAVEESGKQTREIEIITQNNNLENCIELIIKDNGIGIAAGIIDKIFQPFFTTKDPGRGTGLGLSVIKRIVEEHSGEILVSSEVHQGARFIIKIPQYKS